MSDDIILVESVLNISPDPALILEPETWSVQLINDKVPQLLQLQKSSIIGRNIWTILENVCRLTVDIPLIEKELRSSGKVEFHGLMHRSDGMAIPTQHRIANVLNSSHKAISIIWSIIDTSDRYTFSRTIAELELRYRILFEQYRDPCLVIDVKTQKILDANKAASRQLGYSLSELCNMTMNDITPPERRQDMLSEFSRLDITGIASMNGINYTKDRREIPVEVSAVMTEFERRQVFIVICRDISLVKRIEEERSRNERLNAVRQLAGGIAHELAQPLQGLMTVVDLLRNSETEDSHTRQLIDRLPPLVNNVAVLLNQVKRIVRLQMKSYDGADSIVDIDRSSEPSKILIIENDRQRGNAILNVARTHGIIAKLVSDSVGALKLLTQSQFDVILYGSTGDNLSRETFTDKISTMFPNVQVVLMKDDGELKFL